MVSLLLVFFIFVAAVKGVRFERRTDTGRERGLDRLTTGRQAFAAGRVEKPLLLAGLSPHAPAAGAPVLHTVFFAAGSADLGDPAREELARLGPALWNAPGPVVVAGYAGDESTGSPGAGAGRADWLGFARALAVCEFLDTARPRAAGAESPFLPASGGTHGGSLPSHAAGFGSGRDRVDIYPLHMAARPSADERP
jgi:hypothetical protein